MGEDFHTYTTLDQFDQDKIHRFARLDAIPGFCLLRSEREYLECYREIAREEAKVAVENDNASFSLEEKSVETEPKAKKARKTTVKAEPVEE